MNQQEKDVIGGIFDRLSQADAQPRDAEAEAYIRDRVAAQPAAPYILAQVVHVQEQALANLNQRVAALDAELAAVKAAPPVQSGGFLSGLFGGSTPTADVRPGSPLPPAQPAARDGQAPLQDMPLKDMPPQGGPWAAQAGQSAGVGGAGMAGPWGQRGGGGGFLSSALTTAAGVAGGLVAGNMLASAFGLGSHGQAQAQTPSQPAADTASATPANDIADDRDQADDPRIDDANYDDSDADDGDTGPDTSDWL